MGKRELVFKDGSFLTGSYRISKVSKGVNQLIFVTNDFSADPTPIKREADFLRSANGIVIATGIMIERVTGVKPTTIFCKFLDKG